jgi:hypothetical protein
VAENVYYRELQRFRQWWLWAVVLTVSALIWFGFIRQIFLGKPFGTNPLPDPLMIVFFILFGIGLPLVFICQRLTCEVRRDGLYVRFFPIHFKPRRIAWTQIQSYRTINDAPLQRFGGWGVRMNMKGEWAYTMGGTEGVELVLRSGKMIVIGSGNAAALKRAMDRVFLTKN